MSAVKYGDIVEYVNTMGTHRTVRVSFASEDLDGMGPGFDGVIQTLENGVYRDSDEPWRSVWGLDRQLVRVVQPAL